MPRTTYVSPPINTAAKRARAYADLAVLAQHCAAGTGDYDSVDIVSIDLSSGSLTIVVTNPLPAKQLARYALT